MITKQQALDLLEQIEFVRSEKNKIHDHPPSDHHIKICEAIIAKFAGYNDRNDWTDDLIKQKGLEYNDGWTLKE